MELRQRPYFPLYVQDFLSDEKLAECSAESTGVYIRLLCIMHKSEDYGSISLKAKDKKYPDPITNFALKLTRQMPYIEDVIERSLAELIEEGVLCIDGDRLFQKRMVRDGQLAETRANAGSIGGKAVKNSNKRKLYNEPGYIYVLADQDEENTFKIGISKAPEKRLNGVKSKTERNLKLVYKLETPDMGLHEDTVLDWFEDNRDGEWIDGFPLSKIVEVIVANTPKNTPVRLSKTKANPENENEIENDNKDISIDINNKTIDNLKPEEVIVVYNNMCPELLTASQHPPDEGRAVIMEAGARIHDAGKTWAEYFQMVHDSDFLTGRNGRWTGCTFGWLMRPENMEKVLNGNYANRAAPAPVESLWKELQKAAKKMAGLYSPYACVGSGEERYTAEQIEAWKQDCWNDLPDQLKQFVVNADELAAIGKLDSKKQEQTVLPRLRRYLGG